MIRRLICIVIFFSCLLARASAEFEKMAAERSKCVVAVQYVLELEESRNKRTCLGMIVNKDGLVLVNATQIPELERVSALKNFRVRIFGGDTEGYPATYLGSNPVFATHYLKIDGGLKDGMRSIDEFPTATCYVGDKVWGVALDNEASNFEPMVLFSNAIFRGKYPWDIIVFNSVVGDNGAPVFNEKGEFIGMGGSRDSNQYFAIAGDNRFNISLIDVNHTALVFAANEVETIIKELPKNPDGDKQAWIGLIDPQVLQPDVAKFLGLEKKCAIVVSDMIKDSPADKAGIKKGDIIVGINGKPVERMRNDVASILNFRLQIIRAKVGDEFVMSIIRDNGEPFEVRAVLSEAPKNYRQSQFKYFKRIGCSVREFLTDDAISRKLFRSDIDAGVVHFVKPNSPASSALPSKIESGDLIKEINSVPMKSYAQTIAELEKLEADMSVKEIVILVEDFNETKVVRVKLD